MAVLFSAPHAASTTKTYKSALPFYIFAPHFIKIAALTLGLGLTITFGPSPSVAAEPATQSLQDDKVGPIELHDVPIDQILELLERWSGKTLLRPQNLPTATVSLNLKQEVTKAHGIRAIETLLSLNGVGVTALDEQFLKITPLAATKTESPEFISGSTLDLPPSGRLATKLFHPKFLRVTEVIPQITSLLNPTIGGAPAIFEKSNAALITDSLTNLQRVENLLAQIDHPEITRLQPKFYILRYAKAGEVVSRLHDMLNGPLAGSAGSANYTPDERTNQIVLFADPQQYTVFDELIGRLDVRSGEDTRTDVINLKHADAKDVASILTQLVSGQSKNSAHNEEHISVNLTAPDPAHDKANQGQASVTTEIKMPAASQFSSLVSILPEERTNSIVVSGTDNDLRLLSELVGKIDVLLSQVRVEVVIAEVTLDNNSTSGISALGLQISGDKLVGFSSTASGVSASGTITRADPSAKPPVVVSGPWDLAGQIALSTTPRKTITHLLSVPTIVTTHNHPGKILVGQSQPIITATQATPIAATGTNTTFATSSQVTYKDIGIELTVKPLIGSSGSVQMEITQEVDDILGETLIDGNQQPTIGRRSTSSFVSAKSGDIIVLGGLQRNTFNHTTSRLGPIPIIGDILGARTREKTRTDLVFFLRPTILTNTAVDNIPALQQIGQLSKPEQQEIKRVIDQSSPSATAK
ncbi:MAG TPA: secretin N-terminal domain-containing protein [Opitutaceae bacterium]